MSEEDVFEYKEILKCLSTALECSLLFQFRLLRSDFPLFPRRHKFMDQTRKPPLLSKNVVDDDDDDDELTR